MCFSASPRPPTSVIRPGILRAKIPGLVDSASVCHATLARQDAVRELAAQCDLVLVAGSAHSSNTLRLREIAAAQGEDASSYEHTETGTEAE